MGNTQILVPSQWPQLIEVVRLMEKSQQEKFLRKNKASSFLIHRIVKERVIKAKTHFIKLKKVNHTNKLASLPICSEVQLMVKQ